VALILAAAAAPAGIAGILRQRLARASDRSNDTSLAVAPDGTVHRLYIGAGGRLLHGWTVKGEWWTEVLDDRKSLIGPGPAVVDSLGRVHTAYYLSGEDVPGWTGTVIVHGIRTDSGWVVTPVAGNYGISGLALAIGPDDRPRIGWMGWDPGADGAWPGDFLVATPDGDGWTVEATGLKGDPRGLQFDPAGHAHCLLYTGSSADGYTHYATDASGSWADVPLPESPCGRGRSPSRSSPGRTESK
jgi:hypothetical protein